MNRLKFALLCPVIAVGAASRKTRVGGQAIIEGVMMRGKGMVSWAVRRPDGEVIVESFEYKSLAARYPILKRPVFRGAVSLYESLVLGLRALTRSAEIASDEMPEAAGAKRSIKDTLSTVASLVAAFGLTFGLFLYLPMKLLSLVIPPESAVLFNVLAGAIRILFFLGYLAAISMWKDIRRIFEYHGAEHKAIHAYEDGKELTLENMRPYPTAHPRCGTSFLILVAVVCILLFAFIDGLVIHLIGPYPNVLVRTLAHLALVPLVSGISYEALRFSGRHQDHALVRSLTVPGLWLQRITTREPDDPQLGVASRALEAALR